MRYREIRPAIRRGSMREFFSDGPTLKGCWSLDGHARDESENANHGTVTGAVPYIGYKDKLGYYFDGNDSISISASSSLNFSDVVTIGTWTKLATISQNAYTTIFSKNCNNWGAAIFRGTTLNCFSIVVTNYQYDTPFPSLDTDWHLLVGTYDGAKMCAFCDEELYSSLGIPGGPIRSAIETSYFSFIDSPLNYVIGTIGETGIWNRALSPSEIFQYYRCATATPRKYWFYTLAEEEERFIKILTPISTWDYRKYKGGI